MTNEIHYGVISDVHQDPRVVPATIEVLKKLGAEKLLINGDIGNQQRTLEDSQNYVAFILDSIGKSGLESYVQPGSHETLLAFGPVIDYFADKYDNLFTISKPLKVSGKNHDLIFLPGSDWNAGGEYHIGNDERIPSGRYIQTEKGLIPFDDFDQYISAIQQGIAQGAMQYANMNDLRKLVNDPDKSIVICHVPRKFDSLDTAVDVAHFWQGRVYHRDFTKDPVKDWTYTELDVMPGSIPKERIELQRSCRAYSFGEKSEEEILAEAIEFTKKENLERCLFVVEMKENRGNKDLKSLYQEVGITKAVSGHFHESGHKANDNYGNHVPEGKFVTDLFWNSGWLDTGQTGILTVRDGKVSYKNICLEEYL